MAENVTNPPSTPILLSSAYTPGDGVLHTSAAAPIADNFRVLIGTTLFTVTGGAGTTTWTATAVEGTTDLPYPSGTVITFSYTAGAVNQIRKDLSGGGVYASLPSS